MRISQAPRHLLPLLLLMVSVRAIGQQPTQAPGLPDAPGFQPAELAQEPQAPVQAPQQPAAPMPPQKQLTVRPAQTPAEAAEALRISKLAIINGRPYDQPSTKDTLINYANDTYLLPALAGTTIRALYSQIRGKPTGWGTDFPGFMQRFGSAYAVTAIDGNVRLGMELIFHEDLRYLPCHGCSVKAKIENALLSEVTARHDETGRRFFTVTPIIADFSGPIIAHSYWYPHGFDPFAGVVATRLVFAVRIGQHLFREFVIERLHKDAPFER